jgi:hypothetical protein
MEASLTESLQKSLNIMPDNIQIRKYMLNMPHSLDPYWYLRAFVPNSHVGICNLKERIKRAISGGTA